MKISPVVHQTLAQTVAGRIAMLILDGTLSTGEQLPVERELMKQLGVSRPTLREALKILEDYHLIEARAGVGWFTSWLDSDNILQVKELARIGRSMVDLDESRHSAPPRPIGPKRLTVATEKPLHIPNLEEDRLGTFEFISWWEREKVRQARVLVVGAGALGNEVIKNLALMGVGNLFIVDLESIQTANLSRSVLFREQDAGRNKAEVAAARAKAIDPDIHVQYLNGDITTELGLGVIRRMDLVIGCLDNREARLAVNRFCYWMNKPWVDGAIQELFGLMRVFVPGVGACYECTLTEAARHEMSLRYSCSLLARDNVLRGKVPSTPTIASLVGAMQAQEALKLIHDLPVAAGQVTHFNGMTNEMHTTAYSADENCESHWIYGQVMELPLRAENTTLGELLRIAEADLGGNAVIELDLEVLVSLTCPRCNAREEILQPLNWLSSKTAACPVCGEMRQTEMIHLITGEERFLDRTLAALGIPKLHIVRAYNGSAYRFYELTGDLNEALHFLDFEKTTFARLEPKVADRHIKFQIDNFKNDGY